MDHCTFEFHPMVLPQIRKFFHVFPDGKISNLRSSQFGISEPPFCDRFLLHVPYCGFFLVWEVHLDALKEHRAPDFVFDDEKFSNSLKISVWKDRIPSMEKWNVSNESSFSCIIKELVTCYSVYKLSKLKEKNPDVAEEVLKLRKKLNLESAQLEVLFGSDTSHRVVLLPGLPRPIANSVHIKIRGLEKIIKLGIPTANEITLGIQIDDNGLVPQLILPAEISHLINMKGVFHIDPFSGKNLFQYVKGICDALLKRLKEALTITNRNTKFFNELALYYDSLGIECFFCPLPDCCETLLIRATPRLTFRINISIPHDSREPLLFFLKPDGTKKRIVLDAKHAWSPKYFARAIEKTIQDMLRP